MLQYRVNKCVFNSLRKRKLSLLSKLVWLWLASPYCSRDMCCQLWTRAWVGIGIWSLYSVFSSVFFHVGSVSVFLKYWLKIANFWYPTFIWRPCWGWPRLNFTVGKLEWWATTRWKSLIVSLAVSIHQRDKQTDKRTQHDSKDRAMGCVTR